MSSSRTEATLQKGLSLHQQGRVAEAAAVYREILAADADNAGALHWLGVIAWQNGDLAGALDLINRSLAVDPHSAVAHSNRGNVLKLQGHLEDAVANYDAAIAINPEYAGSYVNRGVALNDLRRFDEALASFAKAIALRPDFVEAHANRGFTLHEMGRFAEAMASHDRAIALNANFSGAWYNRGISLRALKRFGDALSSYDRAIALAPGHAEAHCNRGIVLGDLHRFDEAVTSYDRALALDPDYVEAHYNRGIALNDLRRFEEGLASCDQAIARRPDFAEAHGNRGHALHELGRFAEAWAAYDKAIALKPDCDGVLFNRALHDLLFGRFEEGWKGYEWRKALHDPYDGRVFQQPRLTSLAQAAGKTVLILAEQGLGDTIQFFRYAALLQDAGARVLFAPQPKLRSLLASNPWGIELVDGDDRALAFDCQVPLMSLPLVFGTVAETIPDQGPYLSAPGDRIARWRERVGGRGFRIGICWKGNRYKHDFGRSFPVTHFGAIAAMPGVRLISLQKGDGARQLNALPSGMVVETLGEDFDAGPDAFLDTAAVMTGLDLVITVDTSVAHVAGALGVPTWIVLPYVADWRWLRERSDTPWYPTMRLFRQPAPGDWDSAFAQVGAALTQVLQDFISESQSGD